MPDENAPDQNTKTENTNDQQPVAPPPTDTSYDNPGNDAEPVQVQPADVIHPTVETAKPLEAQDPVEPQPDNHNILAIPANTPVKKHSSARKKLLALFVVLLLALAGATAWMMSPNKADKTQKNASQQTKEIDLLRIGTVDGPANNLFPKEGLGLSYSQNRQIYEGLVGNEGDGKYVPLLATGWTNPDEKTWIFKLKPNVKFHTGKTLTATDVKRSLEALQTIDFLAYVTSTIAAVEVVNDLEIKIITTEPDSLLLNRLALAFITDQDAVDAEGNNGTGPYKLDKSSPYEESAATLIANDSYHQGRPKTRKIAYTIYSSDAEMVNALKDNKADLIDTIPDSAVTTELSKAGFSKINFEASGTFGVYLNMLRPNSPLANKEVRKALSQAMDRKSLVEELDNNNLPAYQVIPKSLPGHDANLSFPEFNSVAAKETLTRAGYPNGVTLEFVYANGVQPDPPILIKQLEAAGFKIKAVAFDKVDPVLDLIFAGNFDLFSAAYTSDLADSRDLLGALLESTEQSYPVYKDATYDKLLEDSDRELDPTKRILILQEANKYITDNYLWIPLRSTAYVSFFRSDLVINHDFSGGGNVGVYFWKTGQKVSN